ncbi:nucleotidyltransferase family protein [Moraxella nasovis]|uniref:nucleotidyltransferase family protein n=1 Tax=Moraxella nasovis TaxID=2904121 RepID=UPI001F602AAA|nr:nucleotidyltransferase family protein [Moraxella nasovis]UNU73073.1 nucleotidyltransferase family protein [Moraxella nasovis]
MIKQAMILAAGKGTRMQPLTLTTPKPLIMVGDKPLIVWHIERLIRAGVQEIVINIGYLGEQIYDYFDTHTFKACIKISDETMFDGALETAGGIRYALDGKVLSDLPFLLINGDVWTDFNLSSLLHHDLKDDMAYLVLTKNPSHNPNGDFNLAHHRVYQKTAEQDFGETLTFSGISLISPKLVADVPQNTAMPLAPILKAAMDKGLVGGKKMDDDTTWIDVGTIERLNQVESHIKQIK